METLEYLDEDRQRVQYFERCHDQIGSVFLFLKKNEKQFKGLVTSVKFRSKNHFLSMESQRLVGSFVGAK